MAVSCINRTRRRVRENDIVRGSAMLNVRTQSRRIGCRWSADRMQAVGGWEADRRRRGSCEARGFSSINRTRRGVLEKNPIALKHHGRVADAESANRMKIVGGSDTRIGFAPARRQFGDEADRWWLEGNWSADDRRMGRRIGCGQSAVGGRCIGRGGCGMENGERRDWTTLLRESERCLYFSGYICVQLGRCFVGRDPVVCEQPESTKSYIRDFFARFYASSPAIPIQGNGDRSTINVQKPRSPGADANERNYHRKTDGILPTQQRGRQLTAVRRMTSTTMALPTPIHRRPRVHPFVRDDDGDDYVCLNVPVDLLQQWDVGLLSFTDLEAHISVKFGQTNDISRRVGEYRHCSDKYEAIGWVGYFRVRHRKTVERRVHDALYALGIAPTQEICACLTIHREFFPLSAIVGGFNGFLAIIRRVLVAAGETDLNLYNANPHLAIGAPQYNDKSLTYPNSVRKVERYCWIARNGMNLELCTASEDKAFIRTNQLINSRKPRKRAAFVEASATTPKAPRKRLADRAPKSVSVVNMAMCIWVQKIDETRLPDNAHNMNYIKGPQVDSIIAASDVFPVAFPFSFGAGETKAPSFLAALCDERERSAGQMKMVGGSDRMQKSADRMQAVGGWEEDRRRRGSCDWWDWIRRKNRMK
ncbi:hypothetical protein C8R43DRAFT_954871 [Mycena crocata]|nr:hypothetical protein C8R43DRAFT_954871 [Mycena crocata]